MLVATNMCIFVATKVFVTTKIFCRDKRYAATSTLLSLQKTCFVATKIILVAAPASAIIRDLGFTDMSPDFVFKHAARKVHLTCYDMRIGQTPHWFVLLGLSLLCLSVQSLLSDNRTINWPWICLCRTAMSQHSLV